MLLGFGEFSACVAPPFVAVLTGATLARQSARPYWRWVAVLTLALSVAVLVLFVSTSGDVPHPVLTGVTATVIFVTVPVLATFAIERVTATAPRWIAIGIGFVAYLPIVFMTVTLAMQLGEILSPLLPGVDISIP